MENVTRQIQLKCLGILNIVDEVCRRYKIEYSLCGGSVVGAHLYGACLPWDDDIDLMMTRENYNKFLSVIERELPLGYVVQNFQLSDDFSTTFTKIMDERTTIVQRDGTVSGVFLDITVYDKIPNDYKAKLNVLLWKISQIVMIGKIQGKGFKKIIRNLALSTVLKNKRKYLIFFQKVVEKNSNVSDYTYAELFGAYCNTLRFSRVIFENYTDISFEGKSYRIVRDYVEYLTTRYNRINFYEPEEKQVAPHYQYVDLDMPYKEYMK